MEYCFTYMKPWIFRFWQADATEYFMPVVRCLDAGGEEAEGPMIRQGKNRKELLVWKTRSLAQEAAKALVAQSGGTSRIRSVKRPDIIKECRIYSAWGEKVVAVVLE